MYRPLDIENETNCTVISHTYIVILHTRILWWHVIDTENHVRWLDHNIIYEFQQGG